MAEHKHDTYGILAEFTETPAFYEAVGKVKEAGYKKFDCFTPFPVHGLDHQMGIGRSKVPIFTAIGGVTGFCTGMLITWYMNGFNYPLIVGGKPFWSPIFPFPIMYELTILLSAFGTLFGMFATNLLPRHNHPVFEYEDYIKCGDDTFFLVIEKADPKFDLEQTRSMLEELGSTKVEVLKA
ncbi:DUF3341 domain-containing protein [Ruficoccus sp. ZRK36]|uniref:DUF3341 domain-containing protein n=1 Tax=Ruficoccus sp. ZRK36 TaxID=2866311 RepID=UPI001C7370E2|nr:DUF3341 domain-containing protein [Ruficoccus sp. ZRK36]QYY36097.1 DUF3341 domain-containing protein [Ruficoccus sp. ZRK36]